ncbi:hypothetical protein Syn7803C16_104 [Synechococcus phage ACG-2014f]|uniref:Uncharacterized protein n=1 Tax=Synechococcus phage ACG-2014f TaxID=1493511 RepID=A0A0E3I5G3_9CAUD|nr:hypothetical protein Syn7803C16_104 [Synechococcus phage ACG-2014f]
MAIICLTTCYVADKKGEVIVYTPGPVPGKTSKWLLTLKPTQRVKFEYVRKQRVSKPMVEYTDSEYIEIISRYLNGDNRSDIANTSEATSAHDSVGSVDAVVSMLQKLDRHMGESRTMGISPRLIQLAHAMDPDTFPIPAA